MMETATTLEYYKQTFHADSCFDITDLCDACSDTGTASETRGSGTCTCVCNDGFAGTNCETGMYSVV